MKRFGFSGIAMLALATLAANAQAQGQTQNLVIVQAATAAATPAAAAQVASQETASTGAAIKTLQQMKAANDDLLKKQRATLEQLEELQKAADQLRIFAHRTGG